jgi:hypothetical protein
LYTMRLQLLAVPSVLFQIVESTDVQPTVTAVTTGKSSVAPSDLRRR